MKTTTLARRGFLRVASTPGLAGLVRPATAFAANDSARPLGCHPRLWYDPGNTFYYADGKLDPVDDSNTVDGLVVGMSVKDFVPPKEVMVTPVDGPVNFREVFARLKRGAFTRGPLIIECLACGDTPAKVTADAKRARQSAARIHSGAQRPTAETALRRYLLTLLLLFVLARPASAAELRAGAAKSCITPALGTLINGGVGPATARHIHDDLFVRALVLEDGATRLAFAVVDTCLLDRPVFDAAKRLVEQHTGLAPERVMMSCTHTHSAGSGCGVHLTEADETYRAWLPGRIADAVRCAANHLAPAQLAHGSGRVPQHVFCRRLLVKPGVTYTNQLGFTNELAKMNWDSPHPADGEPTGPTDPEVFVLSVRHADGRPLALLANYSLHYVGDVGPGHVSADYFGVFADRIQQLLGADRQDPPFVGILCNGTSGDINNINPRTGWKSPAPYTQIRRVAEDVAQEVLRVTQGLEHHREVELRAALRECVVAARRPSAEEVEKARTVIGGRPVTAFRGWNDNFAREQLLLAKWPAEVSMPLQVFRVGNLAIAGWPGEIFAASGLALKQRSPIQPLFNVGLANGWYGYIPPPEQFKYGAYETWRMLTSPLETNAIPQMTDGFMDLLSHGVR